MALAMRVYIQNLKDKYISNPDWLLTLFIDMSKNFLVEHSRKTFQAR